MIHTSRWQTHACTLRLHNMGMLLEGRVSMSGVSSSLTMTLLCSSHLCCPRSRVCVLLVLGKIYITILSYAFCRGGERGAFSRETGCVCCAAVSSVALRTECEMRRKGGAAGCLSQPVIVCVCPDPLTCTHIPSCILIPSSSLLTRVIHNTKRLRVRVPRI